jgi:hypothetical protein
VSGGQATFSLGSLVQVWDLSAVRRPGSVGPSGEIPLVATLRDAPSSGVYSLAFDGDTLVSLVPSHHTRTHCHVNSHLNSLLAHEEEEIALR